MTRLLVDNGFTPVVPPVLVRESTMEEAGFFPTDRSQVYEVDDGELFLVGTSEVPLSVLHHGEILEADTLPLRYRGNLVVLPSRSRYLRARHAASSACTEFDKIEMFSFAPPEASWSEFEALVAIQESILAGLGLPYRVSNIAAGDLGRAGGEEVRPRGLAAVRRAVPRSSRRRPTTPTTPRAVSTRACRGSAGTAPVHTLNGTACAVGRTLVMLFEHYQQPDGTFVVPDVLRPWTGFETVAPKDRGAS